jgi:hypothetical protein
MSIDLNNPDNFPQYRPLLHTLAQLWTPPPETLPPAAGTDANAPAPAPSATTPTTPSDVAAAAPAPSVEARLEALCARVTRLEQSAATAAPVPAPPPSPKPPKPPYVDVPQDVADSRWNVWVSVYTADARYSCLPPTVAQDQFARHNGLSVREFRRWFTTHHTHAPGSPQDIKFRQRISEALERLPKPCASK